MSSSNGKANGKPTANRVDAVFIRKSTTSQDDKGQRDNVAAMLRELSVLIPAPHWFVCTVPRAKVQGNAEFNRLMELVDADRVGTVYVESQDRWGTGDHAELFTLLGRLAEHGTKLYDLRNRTDLTGKDDATEIRAFFGSLKSKMERKDLAYRSLRSRVQNFQELATWPTGTHPFGYGKCCFSADGRLLWEWQPVNRSRGQIFYPDPDNPDERKPGPADVPIPRKGKGRLREKTVLVPSNNPDYVRAVQLVFDLYTRVGLSRRQISARLNKEGLKFNGGHFSHPDVTNILKNPAYTGDIHFGKRQLGSLHTFDDNGLIVPADVQGPRDPAKCLIKRGTHEALVDRKTWELAQQKLASEQERTSHAPRNPAYFLKQLFVCGHCGKGLTGRTETWHGKKVVIYICPTYVAGRCNGHPVACGYQRITHDDAERLLLDKMKAMGVRPDHASSELARANLKERLARLGQDDEKDMRRWEKWVMEGIDALAAYLVEAHPEAGEWPMIQKLRKLAAGFYWGGLEDKPGKHRPVKDLPINLAELRKAVQEVEDTAVDKARQKLAELKAKHDRYTADWMDATERMQATIKAAIVTLEKEMAEWEERTVPVRKRLETLYAAEAAAEGERQKLLAEWPSLEAREKGEAMRRLFKTVSLRWEKTFHPSPHRPARKRKTDRKGRYSYTLKTDAIEWSFAASDLESTS